MYAVMDVGCPDSSGKEQQFMGQEMHGDVQQRPAVGDCLVKTVRKMKSRILITSSLKLIAEHTQSHLSMLCV